MLIKSTSIKLFLLIAISNFICINQPLLNATCNAVKPFDAIVNLGGDCQVFYQMKLHNLRQYALPFDFFITSMPSLCKLLNNKFHNFLNPQNLALRLYNNEKYIHETEYNIIILHDYRLESDFLKDHEQVIAKYERRIQRFLSILNSSKRILFIRKNINRNQAIELCKIIDKNWSHLDYLLIAVDSTDEIKQDWHLPKVKNYYLAQAEPYNWKGIDSAWQVIIDKYNLKTMACEKQENEAIQEAVYRTINIFCQS